MTTFEAVTPDETVETIAQVKVREAVEITLEELTIIQKFQPEYQVPKPKMHRLELIDAEIAKLQEQVDKLNAQLVEKQALRVKVEDAAKSVVLKAAKQFEAVTEI